MKKAFSLTFGFMAILALTSCNGGSKFSPKEETSEVVEVDSEEVVNYLDCSNDDECNISSSLKTSSVEDDPYVDNSLSTGAAPYECNNEKGNESTITVRTSGASECDVVVILKSGGTMIRNAYIEAGCSYTFNLPNGYYQVFFYGGKGWNPYKTMPNGFDGGFVASESYSKDEPVFLKYQSLEYELIPQPNGNFTTEQSSASEIF